LIESSHVSAWVRACALYTAGLTLSTPCKSAVALAVESSSPVVRETALWARTRLARAVADTGETLRLTQPGRWGALDDQGVPIRSRTMFSTIEKVIILKTIPMFSETPDEALTEIAILLQEQDVLPGEQIVTKGDPGSSMFIIIGGKVRVHDDEHTFNTLADNQVFGELALLDSEPRSASVTAIESTHLFKLEQEPFYELMHDRGEVARGIIRMLVTSLRARVQELRAVNLAPPEQGQKAPSD
jgi:CRP/FNR family transcriptional regulator, cyclic AMP receptor protein